MKKLTKKERRISDVNGVPGVRLGTVRGHEWVCYVEGKTPTEIERDCRVMEKALRELNRPARRKTRRQARRRTG